MQDRHLPQLDGLRGTAILIVLLGHIASRIIGMQWSKLGGIPPLGVDLFFVLSGFLITGVLLRAKGKPRFFGNFYARRALRIAPLYFLLLLFIFGVTQGLFHGRWLAFDFETHKLSWWVFALYIQNIYYKTIANLGPLVIAITWSLAIEEQFYTVWPLLVAKLNLRVLSAVAVFLILIAPFARHILPHYGWDPYINPLCRMDAMAMGALLSIWIFHAKPSEKQVRSYALYILAFAAVAGAIALRLHMSESLGKSLIAVVFTSALMLCLVWNPVAALLSTWPLRQTGKISYCLYLVHPSIGAVIYHATDGTSLRIRIIRSVLTLVLSYVLAILSWNLFEKPILTLKKYFESSRTQARIDQAELA
jgi:peptidoglycan/LPS O-acetylase OafA/YrhL